MAHTIVSGLIIMTGFAIIGAAPAAATDVGALIMLYFGACLGLIGLGTLPTS